MAATPPSSDDTGRGRRAAAEAREWDERYDADADAASGRMWSGDPNGSLVAEIAGLGAGTALDVGCGEGADAVWLARRGWTVTAIDPSGVALDRARAAAEAAGVDVRFLHGGLLDVEGMLGEHDLVSAQYPALRAEDGDAAVRALLAAVAPGGTLLVVHHDMLHHEGHDHADVIDPPAAAEHEHGGAGHDDDTFDPADYVMPGDVAAHLDPGWTIEVHEVRARPGPPGEDARHDRDVVLRATRRA